MFIAEINKFSSGVLIDRLMLKLKHYFEALDANKFTSKGYDAERLSKILATI